jgi:hypothetical protein
MVEGQEPRIGCKYEGKTMIPLEPHGSGKPVPTILPLEKAF